MKFFAAVTNFIEVFSGDEAGDCERVLSGFLAQFAKGGPHGVFIAFNGSCRDLNPCGGRICVCEDKKPIVLIDHKHGDLWHWGRL